MKNYRLELREKRKKITFPMYTYSTHWLHLFVTMVVFTKKSICYFQYAVHPIVIADLGFVFQCFTQWQHRYKLTYNWSPLDWIIANINHFFRVPGAFNPSEIIINRQLSILSGPLDCAHKVS